MSELLIYQSHDVPLHLQYQIWCFARIEWWWSFQGPNRLRTFTPSDMRTNVVVIEEEVLISHAEVNCRLLQHEGKACKVFAVGGVFTYPSFRKQGYAKQVVNGASDFVRSSDADIGMLFCRLPLKDFYSECGWQYLPNTRILYGPQENPTATTDELAMILPVSERGKAFAEQLNGSTFYVGPHLW